LSADTKGDYLRRTACEDWGLPESEFKLYCVGSDKCFPVESEYKILEIIETEFKNLEIDLNEKRQKWYA
jgi:hypothetical protein